MPTVFISHATHDARFAYRLADDLRRLGVQVWIAPESIRPGEGWVSAIERGLEESSHVVVVLTPAALESKWVRKETDVAIAQERKGQIQVIPLDVEPCRLPLLLSSYQMVSFRHDYDAGFSQLAAILGVRATPPEPGRPPRSTLPHGAMPEAEVASVDEVAPAETAPVEEKETPGWLHILLKEGREERPDWLRILLEESPLLFEPEMVLIPAGEFLMGSDPDLDKDAAWDHEQPQHTLYLPDYYLARTSVTNAQYAAFVQATGHRQPEHWEGGKPPQGKEDHPVVRVSWDEAVAYCNWLSEVTGKPYRLPSEAEWEKGARGTDGRIYPWGNRWDVKRCNSWESGKRDTTPVGAYPEGASPSGLLDVAGNVWEWTRSTYKNYPYDPEDGRENLGAIDLRVLRGGSWYNSRDFARCAFRYLMPPDRSDLDVGFRLCSPVSSDQ